MKRLACIILAVTVLLSGLLFVQTAKGATVGDTLDVDTHWMLADSPVTFNKSVTVGNNVTLTIDAGVTVNLGIYMLNVYGTLRAAGDAGNPISFASGGSFGVPIMFSSSSTSWNDADGSGSIVSNANFNGVSLQIGSVSPKVDNCRFSTQGSSAVNINGGSPTISNCIFTRSSTASGSGVNGITVAGGSPLITGNRFEGIYSASTCNDIGVNSGNPTITNNVFAGAYTGSYNTGIYVQSGAPQISNNQFEGNGHLNGVVSKSLSHITVSNNVFSSCLVGVAAQGTSQLSVQGNSFLQGTDGIAIGQYATVTVMHNLIDSNSHYGIDGGGYIDSNTITNNKIGIHNPPAGTVNNNNIVGNSENSITAASANLDARFNWWGITDTQTINRTIYDVKVDYTLGTVTFVPFLDQPSSTAPAIPGSTPTITPLPTLAPIPQPSSALVIVTPQPTPFQYSQSFVYQVSSVLNLNLITAAVAIVFILVWVVVILGYVAKRSVSKFGSSRKD